MGSSPLAALPIAQASATAHGRNSFRLNNQKYQNYVSFKLYSAQPVCHSRDIPSNVTVAVCNPYAIIYSTTMHSSSRKRLSPLEQTFMDYIWMHPACTAEMCRE